MCGPCGERAWLELLGEGRTPAMCAWVGGATSEVGPLPVSWTNTQAPAGSPCMVLESTYKRSAARTREWVHPAKSEFSSLLPSSASSLMGVQTPPREWGMDEGYQSRSQSTPCAQRWPTIEASAGKGEKTYLWVNIEELILLFVLYVLFSVTFWFLNWDCISVHLRINKRLMGTAPISSRGRVRL